MLRGDLGGRLAGHLLADPPRLDESDLEPAILEHPRGGDADDAAADNGDVGLDLAGQRGKAEAGAVAFQ